MLRVCSTQEVQSSTTYNMLRGALRDLFKAFELAAEVYAVEGAAELTVLDDVDIDGDWWYKRKISYAVLGSVVDIPELLLSIEGNQEEEIVALTLSILSPEAFDAELFRSYVNNAVDGTTSARK